MAESSKCQACGKDATVHLTQIVENQIHKVDLCESCAQEQGITDPEGFSLASMMSKAQALESSPAGEELTCPKCGLTASDFRKRGQFGCDHCYVTFKHLLEPMMSGMHHGTKHSGKVPSRLVNERHLRQRLESLEGDLDSAVQEERFEEAARVRDEINALKEAHNL